MPKLNAAHYTAFHFLSAHNLHGDAEFQDFARLQVLAPAESAKFTLALEYSGYSQPSGVS